MATGPGEPIQMTGPKGRAKVTIDNVPTQTMCLSANTIIIDDGLEPNCSEGLAL